MNKANECTCPSGDGSLVHPCPAHPAVDQADVAAKLTFINGRPAMCGCQVEYSDGGGEYSDVIYVTLCAKHSGSAILDLVATNRIALTPEYEGQWHADLYLDREIPLAKVEGATPAEAVLALMSAERIDPEQESVEQAGGDERAAFELFVRKHCGMPEHIAVNWDAKFTNDAWEGWKARAALAQPSPDTPYADGIAADLERSDWTPEDALRWYAAGKHFDTTNGRTRIIDTGAVASNALKHLSLPYLEMKGDAELTELREAFAQPSPAQAEQAEGAHVPDEVFAGVFAEWWEEEGQYCRAGGGDYERTFAFQAWRHLYPLLLQARAALAQPSPVLPPFAEKVLAKLRRFYDCASDFESGGVDIGRRWLDLLTQLGLLNRIQRSPALWEISQQGEDLLGAPQHFPAQAEADRPEVAEVAFVLRNIGAMDAEDIDGDNVDLRFEDAEGRDTGCDASIVEYAEKAADLLEQQDRIVGELRADRDSWAEQAEQRLADWDEMRKERDAALARVAELELKLDKSDYAYDNDRIHMRGLAARAIARAKVFDDGSDGADAESARSVVAILRELLAVGPAQAQHSVPEGFIGRLSEFLAQRGTTGKALLRELRAMLAAAPAQGGE
ncbi:TPA: hypothetical protein ACXNQX_005479 [Pseudomonas aeruginosa]